jgi:probable selenium-dependent hydroxylase accessory protein YqeC
VQRLSDALGLKAGDVVGIAGAGGKTTLLGRLADEARETGLSVLVTCTTNMGALAGPREAWIFDSDGDADTRIEQALRESGRARLLGERLREDKLRGVAPERVDALAGRAELVLVEADGARGRSLKAPGPHEPVLPATTTLLIVVAGLDAIGQPFGPEAVHRYEVAAALSGAAAERPIDEPLVAAILGHPDSYPSRRPGDARLALFLNKAERAGGQQAAERLARLLAPPYERVAAGSASLGWGRRVA